MITVAKFIRPVFTLYYISLSPSVLKSTYYGPTHCRPIRFRETDSVGRSDS